MHEIVMELVKGLFFPPCCKKEREGEISDLKTKSGRKKDKSFI